MYRNRFPFNKKKKSPGISSTLSSAGRVAASSGISSAYMVRELDEDERPNPANKWFFVGIDLAPNDGLETGVVVLNRHKEMMRMDKLTTDEQIICFVESLEPMANVVVAIDVPKSLDIDGKWRQQEVKMFPLRLNPTELHPPGEKFTNRCSQRAWTLYHKLTERGACVFHYFNHHAKPRFELDIPFRTRTPRGCRALQAVIKTRLQLDDMPNNLAPSSVLDAMIGSYTAWLFGLGAYGKHYRLFWDFQNCMVLDPQDRLIH